jgi:hypothetical protein
MRSRLAPLQRRVVRVLRRIAAHLPPWHALALYGATLVSEVPVVFVRMLLMLAVAALVLLVKDGSPAGATGPAEWALIPTAWACRPVRRPARAC